MKERITKKDLGYWILILVGIIVTILTVKLADNATAVDYIGFAGTITSILLAVVALMYSFYQNNAYESTTQQLESSSKKIKKAVKELDQVSELKEIVTEIRNESSSIAMSIKGLHETVGTVESVIHTVNSNLEDTRQDLFKNFNFKSENSNVNNGFTDIKQLIANLNMTAFTVLYTCYVAHDRNIQINTMKFTQLYMDEFWPGSKEDNMFDRLTVLVMGILFMFSEFGIFDFEYGSRLTINQFNSEIGDEVMNRVNEILESTDGKPKEYIKKINKFISENI